MNRQSVAERAEQEPPPDDVTEQQLRVAEEMEAKSKELADINPALAEDLAAEAAKIREFVSGGDDETAGDDESGCFYFAEEIDEQPTSASGFRSGPRLVDILDRQKRMLPDPRTTMRTTMPFQPLGRFESVDRRRFRDVVRDFLRWLSRQLRRL